MSSYDLDEDYSHLDPRPEPTLDTSAEALEKSRGERLYRKALRGPNDVVLNGPLGPDGGWGPGRHFCGNEEARAWCEAKYGVENVLDTPGFTVGRWKYLIRGLKRGTK